jgi:hypothetical protein
MHLNLCWFVLLSAAAIPAVASGQAGMTLTQANIAYGPYNDPTLANSNELLDLYVPSGYSTPRPVLIELHGGGWSKGMKGAFGAYVQNAAGYGMIEKAFQSGWAIATANYPLTAQALLPNGTPNPSFPNNTFNKAALSTQRAVQWVRANAATYGLDADRVAIIGGSAGANLGLWGAMSVDAGNPFSPDPVAQQSSKADYVVNCWGPTYVDKAHMKSIPARPAQWEYFGTKTEAEFNLVSDVLTLSASPVWLATRKTGLDIFDPPTASRNSKIPVFGVYEGDPSLTSSGAFTLPELDPHGQVFGLLLKEAFDAYNLTQVPPVNWQDFNQYVTFSFYADETSKNLTSNAVQGWLAARAALPAVRILPVPGSYQQAVPFG